LNFRDCAYEFAATELLPPGCQGTLPPLADFSDALPGIPEYVSGSQSNKYWSDWPELRDSPLFLGVGDGACANIGSKCSTASRIAVTIGTSAAARVCLHQGVGSSCSLKVPSGLFCYRVDRSHVLLGGALTDGGSVIEWAATFLNLNTEEAFLDCVNKTEELAHADYSASSNNSHNHSSVTMIPFLSGERSTGFRDGATGAVMGLTRATSPAHFFKSCLESVSLRLRAILELIVEARDGDDPPCIVVSGKALESNALWRQMVADSSGLKVVLDNETHEGTSRGAARLVAGALDAKNEQGTSDLLCEEEIRDFVSSDPRPTACKYFDRAALAQERYIDALSPLFM
jgi:gluconokinase